MVHSRRVTVARARAPGFEFPGEAFDAGAADGEQGQGAAAAPGGELAQVECVRLAGQAAVSGQVPGEGEPFGIGEGGLDRGERSGWGGSGHRAPPGRAGTGKAGPVPVPAVKRKPNVSRLARSRYATDEPVPEPGRPGERYSRPPNRRGPTIALTMQLCAGQVLVPLVELGGWRDQRHPGHPGQHPGDGGRHPPADPCPAGDVVAAARQGKSGVCSWHLGFSVRLKVTCYAVVFHARCADGERGERALTVEADVLASEDLAHGQ